MPSVNPPRRRRAALALVVVIGLPAAVAGGTPPPTGPPRGTPPSSPCFGAASRDRQRRCRDRALRLTVFPTPDDAVLQPNAACTPVGQTAVLLPCAFGAPKGTASDAIALLGDSHAAHWRAALQVAAVARNWLGTSITRSGCPFSKAVARLPPPEGGQCLTWNRKVLSWFSRHPEVHTVFVSEHSGGRVRTPPGTTRRAVQIKGYTDAWAALPSTVSRIFVIRDTPRNTSTTSDCIARAIRARRPAGPACAVPRGRALRRDPATMAAVRLRSDRVKVINLTSFMCSRRLCQPVIGGALVHRDLDHLTQTFSATLGPYLLRRVGDVLGPPPVPAGPPQAGSASGASRRPPSV